MKKRVMGVRERPPRTQRILYGIMTCFDGMKTRKDATTNIGVKPQDTRRKFALRGYMNACSDERVRLAAYRLIP